LTKAKQGKAYLEKSGRNYGELEIVPIIETIEIQGEKREGEGKRK
jgi:hypothetical protein